MRLEAQLASFSTGLILLASYSILFDFQNYAYFFLFSGVLFLLLLAFGDRMTRQSLGVRQVFAVVLAIIFVAFPSNLQYAPLILVLLACLISFRVRLTVFLPSLLGLIGFLFLQYIDLSPLSRALGLLSANWVCLLGLKCSMDGAGYIHIYSSRIGLPILVDGVKMLLPFYLSTLVGYVVLLFTLNINKQKILAHIFVSSLLTFSMPIITLMYIIRSQNTILFVPNTWLALIFPFAYILLLPSIIPNVNIVSKIPPPKALLWTKAKVLRALSKIGSIPDRIAKNAPSILKITTVVLLVIFFLLSLFNYIPLRRRNDPIVIIDESHSEWEPSWTDYTETYKKDPVSGTNNYFGLLNLLSSIYDCTLIVDRVEKKPAVNTVNVVLAKEIAVQTLENLVGDRKGVLILKCVTQNYSKSEIDSILKFVAHGNGLILISDHTDLWGMSTYLNPIAEQLGYRFQPNAVEDIYSGSRGMVTRKTEFPIFISRFLTGDYFWATGCTLEKLPSCNSPLFEVRSHISCFAFWRNETSAYFLTRSMTEETILNSQFHSHLILSAVKYGNGKTILMTDSTPFNNGLIGFGDHAQFFIAMIEYVASKDNFDKSLIPFLMITTAFLIIILNIRKIPMMTILLIILVLISSNIATQIAHYTIEFPRLKTEPRAVAIVMPQEYYGNYFSGELNITKIMGKCLSQNLTPILFTGPPPNGWLQICARTEEFVDAVS